LKLIAAVCVFACLALYSVQAWSSPREHKGTQKTFAGSGSNMALQQNVESGIQQKIGAFPLQFEENRGQADGSVQFISRSGGYTLFLTNNEAVMVLSRATPSASGHSERSPQGRGVVERGANITSAVIKMKLSGSNATPQSSGATRLPGTVNYFFGKDAKQWRTGIPAYSAVKYSDVYPGIDVVYYGNNRQLEYDFVLNPGSDAKKIALNFEGGKNVAIDGAGNLTMESGVGKLALLKPSIYQMSGTQKKAVQGSYVLRPDHSVGLQVGGYDTTKSLVIDPVLVYSSYLGGSGWDAATSIALDGSGNEYIAGFTISANFPSTSSVISAAPNGTCVGYVRKLDPTLTSILYSSYFGGTNGAPNCLGGDAINNIAVDSSGQAYATGQASSTDFPTTANAFQASMGNGASTNAFLAKLAADGQSLMYCSYLGGSGGADDGYAVGADNIGNAYVVGQATSADFPLTAATAVQTITSGHYPDGNGFLTHIDTTKSGPNSLIYSTVLGGNTGDDGITGIALGSNQNVYVTGWTSSTDFPVTQNGFQTSYNNQSFCGFVSQIDLSKSGLSALSYSSYLCGTYDDWGWGITLDSSANVYVSGEAFSSDFPTTFGQSNSQNGKGFAAKFNLSATGSASLVYSRLLGGNSSSFGDWPYRVVVDSNANAYVVGQTSSTDFPVTSDALQSSLLSSTTGDGFLTVLSPDGSTVLYATYLGGSGTAAVGDLGDFVYDVALDANFNIYMVGQTFSSDFPTTTTGLQTTYGGGGDAFVTELSALPVPHVITMAPPAGAPGSLVTIGGSGFGTATGAVKIGGLVAAIQSWSPDAIVVQVPALLSGGSAQVAVTTSLETSNTGQFTVETLLLSRLSRTAGPAGSRVTIFGSGFGQSQGSSAVTFNGRPAFISNWSPASIEVRVPPDATTGNVVVTVGGTASNPIHFQVLGDTEEDKNCGPAENHCCEQGCDPKLHLLYRGPVR
jgi:hypothetical protein